MTEEIEVEKFRELLLDMYRGFPNYRYYGAMDQIVRSNDDRKELEKNGYLISETVSEKGKDKTYYRLGPNALPLISAWKTEKLTEEIKSLTEKMAALTKWVLLLTILAVILSIARIISKLV